MIQYYLAVSILFFVIFAISILKSSSYIVPRQYWIVSLVHSLIWPVTVVMLIHFAFKGGQSGE